MSRRKIIFVVAGVLVLLLGALIFSKIGPSGGNGLQGYQPAVSQEDGQPPQNLTLGVVDIPGAPRGDRFEIATANGSVSVKNFYKMPLALDQEFLILADNSDYQINYDTERSQFAISLKNIPLDAARTKAEADFLNMLGISSGDACRLNVGEWFPKNSPAGGRELGLSFCNNGAFRQ